MTLTLIAAAVLFLGVMLWQAGRAIVLELRATRDEMARGRALDILRALAPGVEAARADPKALLAWQPLAQTVRRLFPAESTALDTAAGGSFPFTADQLRAAHAHWTTDWLSWERAHDAEYKARTAAAEEAVTALGGSTAARARLDAVEREKLDLYQRRYQEYVQVAKALQALVDAAPLSGAGSEGRRAGN